VKRLLIVVYPGLPVPMVNTLGIYLENPVIYYPVKLQGVGPGGILPKGTACPRLDHRRARRRRRHSPVLGVVARMAPA
jgi:hypothetical protein